MKCAAVSRKKSIARDRNTVWRALFVFRVPKNIINVNRPQMNRYAAHAALSGVTAGRSTVDMMMKTSVSQKSP